MSDHDLTEMDATAQAELVRSGEASPAELVEAAVERAERLNPELNAIIHTFYDEAKQQAEGDLPDGPFKGVPFLLKDLGAGLAGQPLHLGMQALKEADFRLPVDTVLGARFRDAGFVTIGKTNVPELGILPTDRVEGLRRRPATRGTSITPPAARAAGRARPWAPGIVPVAHANDGGGSIRIPASHNGLVGLKPTRQRTSQGPLIGDALSGLTEELVVSRSVRDTAAVLEAVHGAVPATRTSPRRPSGPTPRRWRRPRQAADRDDRRPVRRAGARPARPGQRRAPPASCWRASATALTPRRPQVPPADPAARSTCSSPS